MCTVPPGFFQPLPALSVLRFGARSRFPPPLCDSCGWQASRPARRWHYSHPTHPPSLLPRQALHWCPLCFFFRSSRPSLPFRSLKLLCSFHSLSTPLPPRESQTSDESCTTYERRPPVPPSGETNLAVYSSAPRPSRPSPPSRTYLRLLPSSCRAFSTSPTPRSQRPTHPPTHPTGHLVAHTCMHASPLYCRHRPLSTYLRRPPVTCIASRVGGGRAPNPANEQHDPRHTMTSATAAAARVGSPRVVTFGRSHSRTAPICRQATSALWPRSSPAKHSRGSPDGEALPTSRNGAAG